MIRVLRVLEYEYDTAEQFAHDRQNWTDHMRDRSGSKQPRMQSSVVSLTGIEESELDDLGEHHPILAWLTHDNQGRSL